MEVRKPEKAHGTRWLQHKACAIKSPITGYPIMVAHLEAQAAAHSSKGAEVAQFQAYLKKLLIFNFVLHLLFIHVLQPLSTLSCNLQGEATDLLFAFSSLHTFCTAMEKLGQGSTLDLMVILLVTSQN